MDSKHFEIECHLVLETLRLRYGYDFHNYSKNSQTRRIKEYVSRNGIENMFSLLEKIMYNKRVALEFINQITIPFSEFFRDPIIYQDFKKEVFPQLAAYSSINIWHAGCANGEESYSLAILLLEMGLLHKSHIFATDINTAALAQAESGVYKKNKIQEYEENYELAGGKKSLNNYFHQDGNDLKIQNRIRDRVTFAHHNLVSDGVFGEFNLIVCRNVFIYFNKSLQNKILDLFVNSTVRNGYLIIGPKESLTHSQAEERYEMIFKDSNIYKLNKSWT